MYVKAVCSCNRWDLLNNITSPNYSQWVLYCLKLMMNIKYIKNNTYSPIQFNKLKINNLEQWNVNFTKFNLKRNIK